MVKRCCEENSRGCTDFMNQNGRKFLNNNGKLFSNISLINFKQFLRYTSSSALNLVICWILLFILTKWMKIWYLLANCIIAVIYLVFGLVMNIYWVFRFHNQQLKIRKIILYILVYIFNCSAETFLLYYLTDILGLFFLVSKIIDSAIFAVWNFFVLKKRVFNDQYIK